MRALTIPEVAKLVGVSRQAIYKKVVNGQIPAEKVGRNYIISSNAVQCLLGKELTEEDKRFNQKLVDLLFSQYGDTLRRLAKA